jgi:hypothetical protein
MCVFISFVYYIVFYIFIKYGYYKSLLNKVINSISMAQQRHSE